MWIFPSQTDPEDIIDQQANKKQGRNLKTRKSYEGNKCNAKPHS